MSSIKKLVKFKGFEFIVPKPQMYYTGLDQLSKIKLDEHQVFGHKKKEMLQEVSIKNNFLTTEVFAWLNP